MNLLRHVLPGLLLHVDDVPVAFLDDRLVRDGQERPALDDDFHDVVRGVLPARRRQRRLDRRRRRRCGDDPRDVAPGTSTISSSAGNARTRCPTLTSAASGPDSDAVRTLPVLSIVPGRADPGLDRDARDTALSVKRERRSACASVTVVPRGPVEARVLADALGAGGARRPGATATSKMAGRS